MERNRGTEKNTFSLHVRVHCLDKERERERAELVILHQICRHVILSELTVTCFNAEVRHMEENVARELFFKRGAFMRILTAQLLGRRSNIYTKSVLCVGSLTGEKSTYLSRVLYLTR